MSHLGPPDAKRETIARRDALIVSLRDEHQLTWAAIGARFQLKPTSVAVIYKRLKERTDGQ